MKIEKILGLSFLAGLIALIVVGDGYFPYVGVALFFLTGIGIVHHTLPDMHKSDRILLIFATVLSVFIVIRSHPLMTLLNSVAIFYLVSLVIMSHYRSQSILEVLWSPFEALLSIITSKNTPVSLRSNGWIASNTELLKGLLISVLLLMVVLPILGSVNPLFDNLLNLVNPARFLSESVRIDIWIGRLIVFGITLGLFVKMHGVRSFAFPQITRTPVEYLYIPKIVLGIAIALFIGTQIQYYFTTSEQLAVMGVTHSEKTREIFGQLAVVSLIVLGVIWFDRSKQKYSQAVTYFLLMEVVMLLVFALHSDVAYIQAWGLTHKRLWGLTTIITLAGIVTIIGASIKRPRVFDRRLELVIVWLTVILIGVNVVNFDYLIAHVHIVSLPSGVDYTYLARLSPDSLSYDSTISELGKRVQSQQNTVEEASSLLSLSHKISDIQLKYESLNLREINVYEYLTYLQVRDIYTLPLEDMAFKSLDMLSPIQP